MPLAPRAVWKRYARPHEVKSSDSRASWLVQERMSFAEEAIRQEVRGRGERARRREGRRGWVHKFNACAPPFNRRAQGENRSANDQNVVAGAGL